MRRRTNGVKHRGIVVSDLWIEAGIVLVVALAFGVTFAFVR